MHTLPSDPYLLLSVVNMKLRNTYASLTELCEDLEEDESALCDALEAIGYRYDPEGNQFK